MRALVVGVLASLAGCGRLYFDPLGGAGDGATDGGGSSVTYLPSIADCLDPGAPDPAFCRAADSETELSVDLDDDELGVPFYSYLRFDIDTSIPRSDVRAVVLRLVISDNPEADGPSTGEIWRVAPFAASDLYAQAPALRGATPIGAAQGPVDQLQVIEWSLATDVIDDEPLCIAIVPISDAGVNYWNLEGVDPPRLRIDLR